MKSPKIMVCSAMAFLFALAVTNQALAISFTIDSTRSQVTLSGSVSMTGIGGTWDATVADGTYSVSTNSPSTLQSQDPADSRTTSISGSIDADVIDNNLVFNGGSIIPDIRGTYSPDGSSPVNLAPAQLAGFLDPIPIEVKVSGSGFIDGFIVDFITENLVPDLGDILSDEIFRDGGQLAVALRSSELSISGTTLLSLEGGFSTDTLTGRFNSGVVDTSFDSYSLPGEPFSLRAGDGKYTTGVLGDELFLPFEYLLAVSIPVSEFVGGYSTCYIDSFLGCVTTLDVSAPAGTIDIELNIQGIIVATASQFPPPTSVPEPSTILLFGSGLAGLAAWRYRKSKTA